jgi:hypothetical protein
MRAIWVGRLLLPLQLTALFACSAAAPPDTTQDQSLTNSDGGFAATGTLSACATASIAARRIPVYMLVLLDGSGSMVQEGKWDAVTGALSTFFDDAATRSDPGLAIGLTVFSDSGDLTLGWGPYPTVDVPIRYVDQNQASQLSGRFAKVAPSYETPMAAALVGQFPRLEEFAPEAPLAPDGKKVLVLMTDGVPYPDADAQRPVVLASTRAEAAKDLTTFVVGIGSATPYDPQIYDPRFLAQVAIAGGAANDGCDPAELIDTTRMCH